MDPAGVFATSFAKDQALIRTRKQAVTLLLFIVAMFSLPLMADARTDGDEPSESDEFFNEADAETVEIIKDLIETRVRPAVANDGGDITFRGFKDGIVYLNMKGSCAGCPSSTATLQHGIQNLLKHFVPDVIEVRPI